MKGKQKYIAIAFILLVVVAVFIAFSMYNKPHVDVTNAKADLVVTAKELLVNYQNDEELANTNYVNKLLEVSGEIHEIKAENGNSIIVLKDTNTMSTVQCHMAPEENLKVLKLKKDGIITIKGICTGYLLDVIVVRCILVTK